MAVITPESDLIFLKVPLEIDNKNQLTFANTTAQYNYFYNLTGKRTFDKFTYIRKDGVIKVPALIDDLYQYNYVMYRNENFSNKWFYAYITGYEFESPNCTAVSIKTDVWQTWQFELTYKPVLIDREHQNTDVAGDNLLPEELEVGDFVTNGNVTTFGSANSFVTVIEVSQVENTGESATLGYSWVDGGTHNTTPVLNDITRGTTPLIVSGANDFLKIRDVYDWAGLGDAIVNVYMLPATLVGTTYQINLVATRGATPKNALALVPDSQSGATSMGNTTFTKPTTIDGYTPINKKLLTAPFCFFNISNSSGSSIPFYYEDFSSTIKFNIEGTFGAGGNVKAIPVDYKGISSSENGLDYSIRGPKYPICSWKSDSYTNWLTQNGVNMQTEWRSGVLGGALSSLGNLFTGGALGFGGGIVTASASLLGLATQQHLAKTRANFVPDQVKGNLNAGDIVWAKYTSPFTYLPMSIKAQFARCIDGYFSQYGYKCNRVKLPNITGRTNWNFVRTIGAYIEADIPQEDLNEIKGMFDAGITFWHNPSTFGDYSQSNTIVS